MKIFSTLLLLLTATVLSAQTVHNTAWQVGVGSTEILDTYLSQEKFSGTGITFLNIDERQRDSCHWSTVIEHELNLVTAEDRAGKREELQGGYTLFLGRQHQWLMGPLRLQAGAMAAADLGFIYNSSNSNNPAQGDANRCGYLYAAALAPSATLAL